MRYALSQDGLAVLARYAWSRTILVFDFDGTLAPIVARPDAAHMRATTRARLIALAKLYPCAVISGRERADVAGRLVGIPLVEVVGNHGLEPSRQMSAHAKTVSAWLPKLRRHLEDLQGIEIEDKHYSLAIHYRRSRRKRMARALIADAVARLGSSVRLIGGKQVANVVPLGAPHKGMALERLRSEANADTAVYVGDDTTDEDVFALDQPGRLLSIRIGKARATAAPYYLDAQSEIDALIEQLVALRAHRTNHRVEEM